MRKIIAAVFTIAIVFSLCACVPVQEASIDVGPDMSAKENVQIDFVQLHNDTLAMFDGQEAYLFITGLDIDGNNENKTVNIKAVCLDGVEEDLAKTFASAVLCKVNDAAAIQDSSLKPAGSGNFGSFWDKFNCELQVYSMEEAEKENGTPLYKLHHTAGEAFDLDPDFESYEADYERQKDILIRNEE